MNNFKLDSTDKYVFSRISFRIPGLNRTLKLSLNWFKSPNAEVKGIGSLCFNGLHVLFFDYDSFDFEVLENEIKRIQALYFLPSAYVFKSGEKNFHVMILSKHSLREAYKIISSTNTDTAFINAPKFFKSYGRDWILRISGKGSRDPPKFVKLIKSKHNKRVISSAHKRFIEIYYSCPKEKYLNEDKHYKIGIINYNTANRV